MSQSYIVIVNDATVQSATGSGPSYTVDYLTDTTSARVGDKVIVEKRAAGAGGSSTILSTYTYIVTAVDALLFQLTIKYESDTAGLGDDSPADLYSGTGSSGSPSIASHDVVRLTSPFILFMD